MIVCPSEFTARDPQHPDFAHREVDFYQSGDHRLSLRRRFDPLKWEVYRYTYLTESTSVVFASDDLQRALDKGGELWTEKYHGGRDVDTVCTHSFPGRSRGCRIDREEEEAS